MFLMLLDTPMRLLVYKSDTSATPKQILDIGRIGKTLRFSTHSDGLISATSPRRKKSRESTNDAMHLRLNVDERGASTSESLALSFDNTETSSSWINKLLGVGAVSVPVADAVTNLPTNSASKSNEMESFYSYTAEDIHGKTVSMADFRNKVILVLNVASQ